MPKLIEQKTYSMELGLGEFMQPVIMFRDESGEYFPIAHICTTGYDAKTVKSNTQLFQNALDMYILLTKIIEDKKCNAKEVRAILERINKDDDEDEGEIETEAEQ